MININNIEPLINIMTNNGIWATRNEQGVHLSTSSGYNELFELDMMGVNLYDFIDNNYVRTCIDNDIIAFSMNSPLIVVENFEVNGLLKCYETFRQKITDGISCYIVLLVWELSSKPCKSNKFRNNIDFLTGLNNKRYLSTIKDDEYRICVCINIDNFNIVNEIYDYNEGNSVLIKLSRLLVNNVGDSDAIIRWGGDEFVILFNNNDLELIENKVVFIRTQFEQCYHLHNLSFSFGVSYYVSNIEDSVITARTLMQRHKLERFNIKVNRKVIILNDFYFVFQPEYYNGEIYSYEALLRSEIEQNIELFISKVVNYKEFDTAVVLRFYDYVKKSKIYKHIRFSLNIFLSTLEDNDFVELLIWKFSSFKNFTIELIENYSGIYNIDKIQKNIYLLQTNNIKVALDDYGKGYANLDLIKNINFDFIKIDKMFVLDIDKNNQSLLLLKNTITMLLDISQSYLVIEGVETELHAIIICKMNMMDRVLLQGFYYSKPVDITLLMPTIEHV